MRNLLTFIIKNSSWLVAIVLIVASFYLVFSHNSYQRSVYLSSANVVTGKVFDVSNKVVGFIHLDKNNKELLARNAKLAEELYALKAYRADAQMDSVHTNAFLQDSASVPVSQFSFIPAEVSNVSFSGPNNFITVNKGSADGVRPDMGVISQNGVVGVVMKVSTHFSVVIPIINPKFRLSAKLKNSDNTGSIAWDGKDLNVTQLTELPKHEVFEKGDTVLTSFSRIFPKDIIIGYIVEQVTSKDDKFNALDVRLATDFYTIRDVLIINDSYYEEQSLLEKSID